MSPGRSMVLRLLFTAPWPRHLDAGDLARTGATRSLRQPLLPGRLLEPSDGGTCIAQSPALDALLLLHVPRDLAPAPRSPVYEVLDAVATRA